MFKGMKVKAKRSFRPLTVDGNTYPHRVQAGTFGLIVLIKDNGAWVLFDDRSQSVFVSLSILLPVNAVDDDERFAPAGYGDSNDAA